MTTTISGTTGVDQIKDGTVTLADFAAGVVQSSATDATAGRLLTVGASAPDVLTNLPIGGSKNKIINGTGRINQRNVNPTTSGSYGPDRWMLGLLGTSLGGVLGNAANGSISLNGPHHFFIQTQTAKATLGASDYMFVQQLLEGFNVADFKFGTPQAKQITLSFRAAGTPGAVFSVAFRNVAGDRSYVVPVTLLADANTYTVTLPGDLSGTWETGNLAGLVVSFTHAASQTGTFTASAVNQWLTGNLIAANTQSNGFDTVNKALSIGDVQLEVGSVATPFENRSYGQELALCQRYYHTAPFYLTQNTNPVQTFFPVEMRTAPTVSGGGVGFNVNSGPGASRRVICSQTTPADHTLIFSAEL
jgi:hypothetical protein